MTLIVNANFVDAVKLNKQLKYYKLKILNYIQKQTKNAVQYNNKTENGGKASRRYYMYKKIVHVCTNKISQIQLFLQLFYN